MATKKDDDILDQARERYKRGVSADRVDRTEAMDDVAFVAGNQWRPEAQKAREKKKRPVSTWNRLQTFVAQVVNGGRENKPAIQCTPMDGGSKDTAEMLEGRIRHLEYETDADIAYDTTREHQVMSGRAFLIVRTEYVPDSFRQRLRIEPIQNQFSVVWDDAAKRYDKQDADFWFISSEMTKDAFERKYGKKTVAAKNDYFESSDNPAPDWIGIGKAGDNIHVAEYWVKEYRKRTLCMLTDLSVAYKDELPEGVDENHIAAEREEDCATVMQYVINGCEILDRTEWIGKSIPIVPVWGKQMLVEGVLRNYSLVRFAKEPQRLVNLYVSNIIEQIAQMPKAPYIAAAGQLAGFEDDWKKSNTDPLAVLLYNVLDINGIQVPPPQRVINEPPIQALTMGLNQAIDAIKAAMGIFDAAMGAASNETSGIAIQRRRNESDVANFHFPDNESRSRKALGRILLELIPEIDRDEKEVATRGKDGKAKSVKIGEPFQDEKTGKTIHHDLDKGSYEPAISTGPSYLSQRQEANDAYRQIALKDPTFMQKAGDLLFRTMDAPGADAIADRYEKMLPAELKPEGESDPNAAAQQLAQSKQVATTLQQQLDHATQLLQQQHAQIESGALEVSSRERIAAADRELKKYQTDAQETTKRTIALMTLNQKEGLTLLEKELDTTHQMADRAHAAQMIQAGQQHRSQMQQAAQQQAQQAAQAR